MNCKYGPFLNEPCSFLIWGIQEYWITLFSGKSWVATQITPILEKLKGSLATDHVIETPCIKCTFRFMKWDQVIEYLIRRCSCAQWEPHWLFDYTTAVSGHMTAQSISQTRYKNCLITRVLIGCLTFELIFLEYEPQKYGLLMDGLRNF